MSLPFLTFFYLQHQYEYLFLNRNRFLTKKPIVMTWNSGYVTKDVDKRMFYLLPFIFEILFNRTFFKNRQQREVVIIRGQKQLATVVFGLHFSSIGAFASFLFNVQLYKDLLRFPSRTIRSPSGVKLKLHCSGADVHLARLSGLLVSFLLIEEDLMRGVNFNFFRIVVYNRSPLWNMGFKYLLRIVSPFLYKRNG